MRKQVLKAYVFGQEKDQVDPTRVFIDEAHRFAPQEGWAASGDAVRELTSRGRKRGFTAVLATQRMAKINKNVTGDVTHWFIGRVGQATDRKVAADQLGFSPSSAEAKELQVMPPRTFYAFGPAVAVPTRMFRVGDTQTTIVKAGQARIPTPPAPEAMSGLLAALTAAAAPPPETKPSGGGDGAHTGEGVPEGWVSPENHEAALAAALAAGVTEGTRVGHIIGWRMLLDRLDEWSTKQRGMIENDALWMQTHASEPDLSPRAQEILDMSPEEAREALSGVVEGMGAKLDPPKAPPKKADPFPTLKHNITLPPGKMKKATVDIIAVYEKVWPRTLPWLAAAKLAGVGLKSSQFKVYEPEAIASGQLERIGDGYRAKRGVAGGSAEMLAAYGAQLSPAYHQILMVIQSAGQQGVTRDRIVEAAGISPTSSTTSGALRQMIDDLFVEKVGDIYRLTEAFR